VLVGLGTGRADLQLPRGPSGSGQEPWHRCWCSSNQPLVPQGLFFPARWFQQAARPAAHRVKGQRPRRHASLVDASNRSNISGRVRSGFAEEFVHVLRAHALIRTRWAATCPVLCNIPFKSPPPARLEGTNEKKRAGFEQEFPRRARTFLSSALVSTVANANSDWCRTKLSQKGFAFRPGAPLREQQYPRRRGSVHKFGARLVRPAESEGSREQRAKIILAVPPCRTMRAATLRIKASGRSFSKEPSRATLLSCAGGEQGELVRPAGGRLPH